MHNPLRIAKLLVAATLLLAAATACSSRPDGVLSQRPMARLLADLYQAEGIIDAEPTAYASDTMRLALRQAVYARHGVDAARVDSSLDWYGRNIEDYMDVCDMAIEILEKRQKEAYAVSATAGAEPQGSMQRMALEGDSIDVWTLPRSIRFYTHGASDYVTLRLWRDNQWEEGDRYTLALKPLGTSSAVTARLEAEMPDGSYRQAVHRLAPGSGLQTLRLDLPSTAPLPAAVTVTLHYRPAPGEQAWLDSLSLIRQHPRITRPGASPAR